MTLLFIAPNIFTFTFDKPDEDNLGDDIVVRRYTNSELITRAFPYENVSGVIKRETSLDVQWTSV